MQTRAFALKFVAQGGIVYPVDPALHKLAVEFAEAHLSSPVNFADYENVLVVCETDEEGKPVVATGVNCRVVRYDYPVWRALTADAMDALIERTRSSLDDAGFRGTEVFVHVAEHEAKESRCPQWRKFLRRVKAEKASRWKVKV